MTVSIEDITAVFKKSCPSVEFQAGDEDRALKDLGVDSLDMANALLEVQERYGVVVPDEEMPRLQTISSITQYVADSTRGK